VDQGETAIIDLPLAPRHEEASSSSAVAPVDGPEADAWLELMKQCDTFDKLVTIFYDSFTEMTGLAGAFFGLQQGIYDSCGVRIDSSDLMP